MILIVIYTTYVAQQRTKEMLVRYEQDEIYKIKANLKNFVDVAYSTIELNYNNSMDKDYLEKHYGYRLKNIIDVITKLLELKAMKVKAGKIDFATAQKEAIEEIEQIRYDQNKGYIWITNTTSPYPKMIMHPLEPSLNGKVMDDPKYNNANGKDQHLFKAFIEVIKRPGEGFVDYLWPKTIKKGVTIDVPKLSYVKLFREWDWIIGTDFYIDDAILDGMERSKEELRRMRYNNGIGFFWINNLDENLPQFYMYPISTSIENIVLTGGGSLDKMGNVVKSFINTCKNKGSGYVEYTWDKPTVKGDIKDVPKLSYVRLYEPLNWIIGTGVYMDDVDKFIGRENAFLKQQIWKLISNISIVILIFIGCIIIIQYIVVHNTVKKTTESILLTESVTPQKESVINTKIFEPPNLQTRDEASFIQTNNNYLKIAQEISKVMLAQAKLLTLTSIIQTSNKHDTLENAEKVHLLSKQIEYIVADIKKNIDGK
ncbi:MAG: cache domain-containing protein [Thiomargarita sp.]|nr:cache domain-containing protein [Thiomargarita sp.]